MPYTPDVDNVGLTFVREYYSHLSENPTELSAMYGRESQMVTEGGVLVEGVEAIKNQLAGKTLEQRKFRITNIGSYASVSESVLVIVQGTILTRTSSMGFRQTFLLGASKAGTATKPVYYVHNDVVTLQEATPLAAADVAPAPVAEEPVYEPEPEPEVVPEPEPEPEAAFEPEPEPEVVPEPVKAATPVQKPVTPKVEPVAPPQPEVKRSGWAGIAARKAAPPAAVSVQKVSGGSAPGLIGVQKKAEDADQKGQKGGKGGPRAAPGPRPQAHTLYVYGIPRDIEQAKLEDDIAALFGKFGAVRSKTVKIGFCFVDFVEKAGLEAALAASAEEKVILGGEKLKCQRKDDKPAPKGQKGGPVNGAAPAPVRK